MILDRPTDSDSIPYTEPTPQPVWRRLFGEARTRILLWYIILIVGFVLVSLPLMRQRIFAKVDVRVREDLREDLENFQELIRGDEMSEFDRNAIERIQRTTKKIYKPNPQTVEELKTVFDVYMARRIPEDDTFLIGIVDGNFYKASPSALPKALRRDQPLMQRWKKLEEPVSGEQLVENANQGSILYIVEPIMVDGKLLGAVAVAHTTSGEREEALEALIGVAEVIIGLMVVVLILAWWLSGRVLAPLRSLSFAAHQISESDLTARIPVQGNGEIAELASTFNEMMDRLQAAFDTQRNFINDASHELRTPITIIRGNLELIDPDDPDDQTETITLVIDELDRMSRLVNDLILLTKSERSDFLQLETVNITSFIEELFGKAKALGDRTWQVDATAKGIVVIDRQRITEAMMNLAQNAVQHTAPTDTIALGSSTDRNHFRLWVRDTGEGIKLDDQKRVFDRFSRATNTRRRSEGSGLGLSIVKAIVDAHHGDVLLKSSLGNGSTFTLVLPVQPPSMD
jgi:signal transduction histidine kinase